MIVFKGSAFYFLRLLIQFIIRGNNTFGMGVGMVRWYGMEFSYHTTYQTTVPYQVLQYVLWQWGQIDAKSDHLTLSLSFQIIFLFPDKNQFIIQYLTE